MKIRPVILCGGAGTRLWSNSKNHQAKQFIDFGGWNLFQKTLLRIKNPIFDYPIISTNLSYLALVRKYLSKYKINKGQGKYLLKKMMEGLLPDEIIYRKKMGFPTPLKLMFQDALKDYSSNLLLASESKIMQYFERSVVERLLTEHQSGQSDHHRILWQLVVLEEWLQQHG